GGHGHSTFPTGPVVLDRGHRRGPDVPRLERRSRHGEKLRTLSSPAHPHRPDGPARDLRPFPGADGGHTLTVSPPADAVGPPIREGIMSTIPRWPNAPSTPPDRSELHRLDAWWRAANYLSVGQIYLRQPAAAPSAAEGGHQAA